MDMERLKIKMRSVDVIPSIFRYYAETSSIYYNHTVRHNTFTKYSSKFRDLENTLIEQNIDAELYAHFVSKDRMKFIKWKELSCVPVPLFCSNKSIIKFLEYGPTKFKGDYEDDPSVISAEYELFQIFLFATDGTESDEELVELERIIFNEKTFPRLPRWKPWINSFLTETRPKSKIAEICKFYVSDIDDGCVDYVKLIRLIHGR